MTLESVNGRMRQRLIQFGTTLILTVCIWGHVSEIFDHWDNTFKTGTDIEYSTVIVVLIAGTAIAFAHLAILLCARATTSHLLPSFAARSQAAPRLTAFVGHSPPQPLRI